MKDFNKMTLSEISAEMERFQLQIMRQQAQKMPMTDRQKAYFHALSKAYRKINQDVAK